MLTHRLRVVPIFLRDSRASETRLAFLAWGDFHARSSFPCSTISEEKWGLLVVYLTHYKKEQTEYCTTRVHSNNKTVFPTQLICE